MKPQDFFMVIGLFVLLGTFWVPWLLFWTIFPEAADYLKVSPEQAWSFLERAWTNKGDFVSILKEYQINEVKDSNILFKLKLLGFRFGLILIPLIVYYSLTYKKKMEKKLADVKTSATYAKLKDLNEFLGNDGPVLTKNVRMREPEAYEHIAIIGPTGSGKTASFFMPNLLALTKDQSAVVFDPKGELYQGTYNHHKKLGKECFLLKLDNEKNSICWNPLDTPKDPVQMNKICQSVVKNKEGAEGNSGNQDPFWDASAIELLTTCVYSVKSLPISREYHKRFPKRDNNNEIIVENGEIIYDEIVELDPPKTKGNFRNIHMMLSELSFEAMIGLAKFSAAELDMDSQISRTKSFGDAVSPEETRNSTRSVLKTSLNPFTTPSVAYVTAKTDFKFEQLKDSPSLLFVSVPEHKVDGVKPVLASLYMQIFDSLLDAGKAGHPVFFFLDEFANSGKILGFSQYIATVRSRKLSLCVCLQSPKQLEQSYTEAEKQAILNNLKTWLVLPGLKEETSLKYISEISGKVGYMERENLQSDKRAMEKEKLPLAEIRELEDNPKTQQHEAIVIMKNKPPYKDLQRRFYLDPEFKKLYYESAGEDGKGVSFPIKPPEYFKEIEKECFFDTGDIKFLEEIGIALSCELDARNFSQEKAGVYTKILKRFRDRFGFPAMWEQEFNDMPDVKYVAFEWPKDHYEVAQGEKAKDYVIQARSMIVKTLNWLYMHNLYSVPPPNND